MDFDFLEELVKRCPHLEMLHFGLDNHESPDFDFSNSQNVRENVFLQSSPSPSPLDPDMVTKRGQLFSFASLAKLQLHSFTYINLKDIRYIPDHIALLHKVSSLTLSNLFTESQLFSLGLTQFTRLKHLDIQTITCRSMIRYIAGAIQFMTQLKYLRLGMDFYYNFHHNREYMVQMFTQFVKIETLVLRFYICEQGLNPNKVLNDILTHFAHDRGGMKIKHLTIEFVKTDTNVNAVKRARQNWRCKRAYTRNYTSFRDIFPSCKLYIKHL